MTALGSYSTGTVSIGANATTVVGTGLTWTTQNARAGDTLVVAGHEVQIVDFVDGLHLTINAWPFTAVAGGTSYKIIQGSPTRFAGSAAMTDVSNIIQVMNTDGFYVFVPTIATVPDPSYGFDGQYAFQAATGKLWVKSGGAWSFIGVYKGFGLAAPWITAHANNTLDVVFVNGSGYVCVVAHTSGTFATDLAAAKWQILVATPFAPLAAWVTATAYVAIPPASYVSIGGSSYVCIVAHTSGTFATDLATGKWGLVASIGSTGPTYGGTSTTSLTIGTGAKAFTTQAGLAYLNGARVRASSTATTSDWMEGLITYSGTTLTINVDKTNGTGTLASWNFNVVGQPGAGDLSSANALSELTSVAATARTNIGAFGSSSALGSAQVAVQSDQETATSTALAVTPGRQQFHPSALKAWVRFNAASGTPTIARSYNVSSLADNGAGDTTINWTNVFSDSLYNPVCWGDLNATVQGTGRCIQYIGISASQFRIFTSPVTAATGEDWDFVTVQVGGDF